MLFYLMLETEKIMNWINVKDRLPDEDDGDVLCWSVKFGDESRSASSHHIILWHHEGKWRTDSDEDYENNADYHWITHWMPLPESPKK